MGDAKDILGLSKGPVVASGLAGAEKKSRGIKELSLRKQANVNREVFALTGGVPPLVASVGTSDKKEQQQVSWRWQPFSNSARSDGLQLQHWVRCVEGSQPPPDYFFSKYNKSVDVVRYSEEEYGRHLLHPKWTMEETDHLLDLCNRFDLRFVVISDRFSEGGAWPERSVEEVKDRYYQLARRLMMERGSGSEEEMDHPILREPYRVVNEKERKRLVGRLWTYTRKQASEDQETLAKANPGSLVGLRGLRVHQRVQQAAGQLGRHGKIVEQLWQELRIPPKLRMPTRAVCLEYMALQKDLLNLAGLHTRVTWKENEVANLQDPSASIAKAPSRPPETSPPPAYAPDQKRARKLKVPED